MPIEVDPDELHILESALNGQLYNYEMYGRRAGMSKEAITEHINGCNRLLAKVRSAREAYERERPNNYSQQLRTLLEQGDLGQDSDVLGLNQS